MKRLNLANSPLIVFLEVTRACDLACVHCRAEAQCEPVDTELSTRQWKALLQELTDFPTPPLVVFTGGDPFKRTDLPELIAWARDLGLQVALTPSATPLVTCEALQELKNAGLHRLALSLDGASAETHDAFRGFAGSWQRTHDIMAQAKDIGLSLQINTTVCRQNQHELPILAEQCEGFGIDLWSVFFLVPTGRAKAEDMLDAQQCEDTFDFLFDQALKRPYAIKTTEAHHFRRYVLQQTKQGRRLRGTPSDIIYRSPLGIRDGQGVMFVSHEGNICPSGFLPHNCGQFPCASPVDTYQHHPLFLQLRDEDQLLGKCGDCQYRRTCGGSRARAHALTGNPLGEEVTCIYQPSGQETCV